jgi:hypothetical protein
MKNSRFISSLLSILTALDLDFVGFLVFGSALGFGAAFGLGDFFSVVTFLALGALSDLVDLEEDFGEVLGDFVDFAGDLGLGPLPKSA